MKVTFVSNYINHHQLPVSKEFERDVNIDYQFIQVEHMSEERVKMGWALDITNYPFVKEYYKDPEACKARIMESDVVIFGGVDDESYIEERLEAGKPVIRYSERVYKEGQWKWISPRGLKKKYHDHTRHNSDPVYLLCAGGYVADDFSKFNAYPGKRYKWGYFPECVEYAEDELHALRDKNTKPNLLWAGRMIGWKHPEQAIEVAKNLIERDVDFKLTMIGEGEQYEVIKDIVAEEHLENYVELVGSVPPVKVREYMRQADIYLFTSDYKEGWGAVLNESMNSGCAVVASHAIGAVPFLLEHNVNGYIYKSENVGDLTDTVESLCKDKARRRALGDNAYKTITTTWNAYLAAKRLRHLCWCIFEGKHMPVYDEGPLSVASVVKQRKMYEKLTKTDKIQ